jgi:predicted nucleotidyltransferase
LSELDLRRLLESLRDHDVRFIVIGGVAVGAHGYVRATEDLDVVPDPDPANLDRLVDALGAQDRAQDRADLENLPEA